MKKFKIATVILACSFLPLFASYNHFIQNDEYFISKVEFKNVDWIHVNLAKMIEPASAKTKGESKFLQITDGKEVWTKHFWKTKPAVKTEIKIGTIVIMAEIGGDDDIYIAPENKDEAREAAWFIAKITDTSDLFKDFVTVSGGYKAHVKNLRVIVK